MFKSLINYFSNDLAVDLGTANTLVYVKGRGIVLNEPSVVAVKTDSKGSKKVLSVGKEAKEMVGRTPGNIEAIKPLKDGVIADFEVTERMLRYFIKKSKNKRSIFKPRIIIAVPHGITQVEKKAVKESAIDAGAREVYLVEEPMAAAIGADLPVQDAVGSMVVDIGGGTTEVAVISLGGIVHSVSVRVGGDKMDTAIVNYIKKQYSILIGESTAEAIKIEFGSVYPSEDEEEDNEPIIVKGIDLITGVPTSIEVTIDEIRKALREPVNVIVASVKDALEKTPPELASDIVDNGIMLTGGGALIKGLDKLIHKETGLTVKVFDEALFAVVKGVGMILDNIDLLGEVTID
ncbi:cell shape determining protein, MreB/Mrl family [Hippea maritima DSM 10411]|uniref:Cell shape-determining protein MreB n=2 Tax=Hippea TaxID=84404 RepID=F2LUB6_HIPMA|nr:rod shape-determining protein [Hippea maritima]AEA33442.1 cell shape determining protein, MreB/Mrl family [Hippea maritima DSM 10411]